MRTLNYSQDHGYVFGELTDEMDALGFWTVDPSTVPANTRLPSGCGYSTVLADFDFETYSEAGYAFNEARGRWVSVSNSGTGGLPQVGAPVYSEHPSTEVLSLAYNLKDGLGARLWLPGMPDPEDLFDHIKQGKLIEAWNSAFEYYIWNNVCSRMGWPPLDYRQLRDAMAKARAHSIPGALAKAGIALDLPTQKIADGKRLLNKFSKPRQPTKNDDRRRVRLSDDPVDAQKLFEYNLGDIITESEASAALPDLSPTELKLWLLDQKINFRGVYIDGEALADCKTIVEQAHEQYTAELVKTTGGAVNSPSEIQKIKAFLETQGVHMLGLTADDVSDALARDDLPTTARRVLEIRASLGSASVKKLFAIDRRRSKDGRLRDLFAFCGADRTGRFAGRGPQPQNLPNSGPKMKQCDPTGGCGEHYNPKLVACPWCGTSDAFSSSVGWNPNAVEATLAAVAGKSLPFVEHIVGDAVSAVSGSLRGLFCAAPGHDLICSDYSAIEAVVVAMLAGEQWRIDVFRTHGKIYEMSAAKITGIPFEEFVRHKEQTGDHHPMRKKIGKVAELASAYQGGKGAWLAFGADKFLSEEEIANGIKSWRAASPAIVNFWYGLERAAVNAVKYPGQVFEYNGLKYSMVGDVLYCALLSGRKLAYHAPRLIPDKTPWGKEVLKLTYMGSNSDPKKGGNGWVRLETYGGKLCENAVQATARDILTHALINVENAGYPVVLHVHDEIVAEVPHGVGSVKEFETIMAAMPSWAHDWPIRAAGGWRGKRYRKD